MILRKARIRNFRSIDDSGEFDIDRTTCLVGKNESGKTAVLSALYRLKPTETGVSFIPSRDFPKRRWFPNQPVPTTPVVATKWELEKADIDALAKVLGPECTVTSDVSIEMGYDNKRSIQCNLNEKAIVRFFLNAASLSAEENAHLGSASVHDLREKVKGYTSRSEAVEALAKKLETSLPGTAQQVAASVIEPRVPTFLYFDSYSRLPGRVSLEQLLQRKQNNSLTDMDRLFVALLSLAGTTPETLHGATTFEEFNSTIRAVSTNVSGQIFEYWTQNQYLEVDIQLAPARPQDPAPFNAGQVFHLRINNTRHKADTGFDDRSTGFVWFFSFLIWFNNLSATHRKGLIVLLDEPGLTLHAKAQADLLRYIKEKLTAYQVLYTTHSPFMVDPDNLMAARTVEDVVQRDKAGAEKLLGTQVRGDVLSTDADTVSPLQRALDYELTQTLFVGRNTLLVEGASEVLFIRWFSEQLRRKGQEPLDYRWVLCYVGGVDRIPGFVSLFRGNKLNIAALADVQAGHKQRLENAEKAVGAGYLLRVTNYLDGQAEADIEDMIGRQAYLEIVRRCYDLHATQALPAQKPADAPSRVVKEVEAHFQQLPPHLSEFDHFGPAEWITRNAEEALAIQGMDRALQTFGKLITDLNKLAKR